MAKENQNIEKTQVLELQGKVEKKSVGKLIWTIAFILIVVLFAVGIAFLVKLAKEV